MVLKTFLVEIHVYICGGRTEINNIPFKVEVNMLMGTFYWNILFYVEFMTSRK